MYHPRIFVVILNWNGKDDTLECLESVLRVDYLNYDVIVVDNGSCDDSVNTIQKRFPEITILETGENLGFAGGNNVGIRYALKNGADYILLLNNDTIVDSELLKNFMNASQRVQGAGIFGAKIYYYSEPNKIWYAGGKWAENILHFIHVGKGCIDNGKNFNSMTEIDYACGCAFLVKADLLNRIGLLDEKFFLTFEETDLCYRARKEGFKSYFVPEARVWHKVSTAFGGAGSPLFHYFLMRNRLLWANKNLPFHKRLVLYKRVSYEVVRYLLPPHIRFNKPENSPLFRSIYNFFIEYRESSSEKFNSEIRIAKLLGVRDYLLRRFGNCPESVRFLGQTKSQ